MKRRRVTAPDAPSEPLSVSVDPFQDEDPSDEQILESIRRGMEDVKAGRTRPARQAIAEIRSKLDADVDAR